MASKDSLVVVPLCWSGGLANQQCRQVMRDFGRKRANELGARTHTLTVDLERAGVTAAQSRRAQQISTAFQGRLFAYTFFRQIFGHRGITRLPPLR
jgi:uncharacterized membrane protein